MSHHVKKWFLNFPILPTIQDGRRKLGKGLLYTTTVKLMWEDTYFDVDEINRYSFYLRPKEVW